MIALLIILLAERGDIYSIGQVRGKWKWPWPCSWSPRRAHTPSPHKCTLVQNLREKDFQFCFCALYRHRKTLDKQKEDKEHAQLHGEISGKNHEAFLWNSSSRRDSGACKYVFHKCGLWLQNLLNSSDHNRNLSQNIFTCHIWIWFPIIINVI